MNMNKLAIHALPARKDNYIYALVDGDQCAIIDPGEAAPVERFIKSRNLHLRLILCTHHHPDHIEGVGALCQEAKPEVWTSNYDRGRILGSTRGLIEGDVVELFGRRLEIIELPGHTMGQIGFYLPDSGALFTGDTLFTCGCGRLFEGTAEQMFATLQKRKKFPRATKIYFAHEYSLRNIAFAEEQGATSPSLVRHKAECEKHLSEGGFTTPTTLGIELDINPFMRAASLDDFRRLRSARDVW